MVHPHHEPQSRAGVSPAPVAQRAIAVGACGAGQARRLPYFRESGRPPQEIAASAVNRGVRPSPGAPGWNVQMARFESKAVDLRKLLRQGMAAVRPSSRRSEVSFLATEEAWACLVAMSFRLLSHT